MPVDVVRDTAIRVLLKVFEKGAFINVALDRALRRRQVSERGRRFLTQLVYGTVRNQLLCDYLLRQRLHQPIEDLPRPILAVLRMGVFQGLFCNQVAFPVMVHTSVDLAKRFGHAGTAKLANAVLKRIPQSLEKAELPDPVAAPVDHLSVRHSIPRWLVQRWMDQYGQDETEALCAASAAEAPVTLRVNSLRISLDKLCAGLTDAGYPSQPHPEVPGAAIVLEGKPPARAKLFKEGRCFLQDPASMLAPHLLAPEAGDKILDCCAAPGGKTTHLSELSGGKAYITAMDVLPAKMARIEENVDRLQTPNVTLCCGDAQYPPFPEGSFDKVLLDAPCSGLGTIRRHPELKWKTTPEMIAEAAAKQRALLRSAIRLCKNGGVIVYSVCTITQEETEAVAQWVCEEEPVCAETGPEWMDTWQIATGQYRTLPHLDGLDGFFLMRLRKVS